MTGRIPLLLLFIAFVLAISPAGALAGEGWYLKLKHSDEGASGFAELIMDGKAFRAGELEGNDELIVDEKSITVVNHGEKTYMQLTFAEIEETLVPMFKMMHGMKEQERQKLRESMEDLPPEERAALEEQLEEDEERPEIKLERTKEKKEIAGLSAEKVVAHADGKPALELWVTQEISTRPLLSLLNRFHDLLKDFAYEQGGLEYLSHFEQLGGFPVQVIDVSEEETTEVLTVTEARKKSFHPSDFSPPPAYTKTDLPLMGGR